MAKRPGLTAAVSILAVMLFIIAVAAGCSFGGAKQKADGFAAWLAGVASADIAWAQASVGYGAEQISYGLNREDLSELTAMLNGMAPEQIYLGDKVEKSGYRLFMVQGADGAYTREILFHCGVDGTVMADFDESTAADFGGGKKSWLLHSPELTAYIVALAGERGRRTDGAAIVPLTPEQLEQVNAAFAPLVRDAAGNMEASLVSCFFTSHYQRPEDIDLAAFLHNFPGGSLVTDAAEFDALKELDGIPFGPEARLETMPVPVHKYTVPDVDQALEQYMGVSSRDLSGVGSEELYYLAAYDAYYNFTSDFATGVFPCTRGELEGDELRLYARYGNGSQAMLTLRQQDGRYLITSLLPVPQE